MTEHITQHRESYERVVARLKTINDVTATLTQSFDLGSTLEDILDQVLETGIPVEIERKGRIVRLVADKPPSKLGNLPRREDFIVGEPDGLIHCDWSSEWHP